MLNHGTVELVAFILGRVNGMIFDHYVAGKRGQAEVILHSGLHDTKAKQNKPQRDRDYEDTMTHPYVKVKKRPQSFREGIKSLSHG